MGLSGFIGIPPAGLIHGPNFIGPVPGPGSSSPWDEDLPAAPSLPALYGLATSGLQGLYVVGTDEQATVPILGDDSGNGRYLQSTSYATDADYSTTAVDGDEPGIVFSAHNLRGATAADWSFLHSDELTLVYRVHPTGSSTTQVLAATRANTTTPGIEWLFDGVNNRFWALQYNDAGTGILTIAQSSTAPEGAAYTVILRISRSGGSPHAIIRLNGTQLSTTADYSGANGTGAAPIAVRMGESTRAGLNNYAGAIKCMAFYNRALTLAEMQAWEASLPTIVSLRSLLTIRSIGDSQTAGSNRYMGNLWARFVKTAGRRINYVGAFNNTSAPFPLGDFDHDGVNGNTIAQCEARVAGGAAATDIVYMAGSADMTGGAAAALVSEASCLDAIKAEHPTARIWRLAITYGQGGIADYTLAGAAGTFNAALPALCASKNVHFVDIHSGAYAWDGPGGDADDDIGHNSLAGAAKIGNTLAVAMGIGADTL